MRAWGHLVGPIREWRNPYENTGLGQFLGPMTYFLWSMYIFEGDNDLIPTELRGASPPGICGPGTYVGMV